MNREDKIFGIADKITKYNFKEIWDIEGEQIVKLNKNEIAEEMFFKGIAYILDHLEQLNEINIDKVKNSLHEIMEE